MHPYLSRPLSTLSAGLLFACAAFVQVSPAQAETPRVYSDDGRAIFRISVPDFWTLRPGGLRDIVDPELGEIRDVSRVFGMTPDVHAGAWSGMISPHAVTDMQSAQSYLEEIGSFFV